VRVCRAAYESESVSTWLSGTAGEYNFTPGCFNRDLNGYLRHIPARAVIDVTQKLATSFPPTRTLKFLEFELLALAGS